MAEGLEQDWATQSQPLPRRGSGKGGWAIPRGGFLDGSPALPPVGRKQFLKFEWANRAADVLGCEAEELTTAVFKHHLQRILEQVTAGAGLEEPSDGMAAPQFLMSPPPPCDFCLVSLSALTSPLDPGGAPTSAP